MVRARHLTPESIIDAIETGDFYASSGVTLSEVRYDADAGTIEVEVEADPSADASFTIEFIGTRKGVDPAAEPVLGDDGEPLDVTGRYSDEVGRVFETIEGTSARFELTGDELYVRAVVTSSEPPENPAFDGQHAQAWTQPVGWEKWIAVDGDSDR